MKKIFALFCIFLFLTNFSSCNNTNDPREDNMIDYDSGIFYDKNWEDSIGSYKGSVIKNKNEAIRIATTIFESIYTDNKYKNFSPNSIFFDTEDEIWIISFWDDSSDFMLGGNCNIAIQKSDAKVLRIWFGE